MDKQVLIDLEDLPMHRLVRIKRAADMITLNGLSVITGMPATSISEWENGKRRLPWKYREKMNHYLCEMKFVDGQLVDEGGEFDHDELSDNAI